MEVKQEKIDYINYVFNKEITYWKKQLQKEFLNESEEKELLDSPPSRILLIRKEKSEKMCEDCILYFRKPD